MVIKNNFFIKICHDDSIGTRNDEDMVAMLKIWILIEYICILCIEFSKKNDQFYFHGFKLYTAQLFHFTLLRSLFILSVY